MKNIYAWENLENIYEKRKNILTRLSVFFFNFRIFDIKCFLLRYIYCCIENYIVKIIF